MISTEGFSDSYGLDWLIPKSVISNLKSIYCTQQIEKISMKFRSNVKKNITSVKKNLAGRVGRDEGQTTLF